MSNINFHYDCKILSQAVYNNNSGKIINGWHCIKSKSDKNGYYAEAYKKDNNIIIVSSGTDKADLNDLKNDVYMASGLIPEQLKTAREFRNEIEQEFGQNCCIKLTGHSLGGSISQALGSETGDETVTFSAYGINHIQGIEKKYSDNITNYGSENDGIFMSNIDNQIGKTMVVTNKAEDKNFAMRGATGPIINSDGKYMHKSENWDDLSQSVEYKKPDASIFSDNQGVPLYKLRIEKNVDIPEDEKIERYKKESELFAPENRVFYENELNPAKIPIGSFEDNYVQEFMKQYIDSGKNLPSEKELQSKTGNGELIYVRNYTRADGTKVSGYYRTK